MMNLPKRRHCKSCEKIFKPTAFYEWWCSDECKDAVIKMAVEKGRQSLARKRDEQKRAQWRERKANVKPLSHWINMSQRVFNDYIRARDGDICISCGSTKAISYHAGHYRTTAAASQIRFNEDNCSSQCAACNVHQSGAITQYRINLIAKIGLQRVLALENDNTPHRYTREELDGIRAHYRAKLRELLKQREAA